VTQLSKKNSILSKLIERDNGICHWCKRPVFPRQDFNHPRYPSRDHLIKREHGGSSSIDNLVLACRKCNSDRHNPGWVPPTDESEAALPFRKRKKLKLKPATDFVGPSLDSLDEDKVPSGTHVTITQDITDIITSRLPKKGDIAFLYKIVRSIRGVEYYVRWEDKSLLIRRHEFTYKVSEPKFESNVL